MKRVLYVVTAPWRWLQALWHLIIAPWRWLTGRGEAVRRFFTEAPEEVSLADTLGDSLGDRAAFFDLLQGFGEHLEALRGHLLRSVIAFAITTGLTALYAQQLMNVLAAPIGGLGQLQVIEPTESVGVFMRVSMLFGVAFAMPWIVTEAYLFVAPGLMPRSRIFLLMAIPAASLLFLLGVAFTYFVMLPPAIGFLRDFLDFQTAWRPSAYFGLVTNLMFWVGVAFQMPLIIYALAAVGLLRARQLLAQWRIAILAIAIVAAAITPTTDPVNMALVMLPMILLYFFSIAGAWFAERGLKRSRAGA